MSWRIGISSGACINVPIQDVVPAIAAAGAVGVEIGTPLDHFNPREATQIAGLSTILQAHRIEAVAIHTPFGQGLDLADGDPAHRQAGIDAALTGALALAAVGGRLVVVHPSDLPRHAHDAGARLADAAVSLRLLAEHLETAGMTLAVESPLPHLIGGHPDEFAALLDRLPATTGVCLDTGHTALGGHWHHFLQIAKNRLVHVHAHDNRGTWDDHLPPGDGHLDWHEIASSLRAAHFNGWIMLELACPGSQPLAAYLSAAYTRASALLAS